MSQLFGVLLASVIGASILLWALPLYLHAITEPIQNAAMVSVNNLTKAAQAYLSGNFATLLTATSSGPVAVTPATLVADHYLYSGFVNSNAYGQQYIVVFRQPAANELSAMVFSYGGDTISDQATIRVGESGPGNSTIVLSTDPTNFEGAAGGLVIPISDFSVSGYPITPGHVGAYIPSADYSAYSPYLNRYNTGNPEDNTMHTAINMNSQNITNGGDVTAQDVILSANGSQRVSEGVYWSGIVHNGDIVPKPTCPSGEIPQIFVNQAILSDNNSAPVNNGTMSAIQAWAIPNGTTSWTVELRVETEAGLQTPDASHGQAPAYVKCG